jgi:hypothetical protein
MVQAEAIAAISALRRRTWRDCTRGRVRGAMDDYAVPIHIAALLYQLR